MALASYLTRKAGGRYHLRVRVPLDLIAHLGRQEIRRSLMTADPKTARLRAGVAASMIGLAFEGFRMSGDLDEFWKIVAEANQAYAEGMAFVAEANSKMLDAQRDLHWIKEAHFETDKRILIGALGAALTRGAPQAPVDPFAGLSESAQRPFYELVPAFFGQSEFSPKTVWSYEKAFDRFKRIVAEKPIALIDRNDGVAYLDLLLSESGAKHGRARLVRGTITKNLSHLKTFFTWAMGKNHVQGSPLSGIVAPAESRRAKAQRTARSPYTHEELTTIFASPLYTGCLSPSRIHDPGTCRVRDGRYWMPLLALFSGARLGELEQLETGDVVTENGFRCISINIIPSADDDEEDREKTVKSANAIRTIPIHPELERLGFLGFVEERRRLGKRLVFEEFDYGKWWNHENRFLDRIGLKRPDLVFHSFRHSFKRMIRVIESDETKNRLMGHAPKDVGEMYGGKLSDDEMRLFCTVVKPPISLLHLTP